MGLVDYDSDSGSGSGSGSEVERATPTEPKPKPRQASSKKTFQKVVNRSSSGKIVVNLPTQAPSANGNASEPPAKRPRTTSGGLFAGFNSLLPPPKNTDRHVIKPSTSSTTRPGVQLKTSAEPGFSRRAVDQGQDEDDVSQPSTSTSGQLSLPPPKGHEAAPSIPEGQTPAGDVTLVGKPLMFRPLSVDLNAKKKKKRNSAQDPNSAAASHSATKSIQSPATSSLDNSSAPVSKKNVSLFSMYTEGPANPAPNLSANDAYEPVFETPYEADALSAEHPVPADGQYGALANAATGTPESLDHMADDLGLSAAARRELFGRDGSNFAAKKVVNFNMDKEYQHNEHVRASGDQQVHHPVRALQSGKHSLKQLVQNVQSQKDALEDSFAMGRSTRKEASSRYGW